MLTNNTPKIRYRAFGDNGKVKTLVASSVATTVMAAGSVIKLPNNGPADRAHIKKAMVYGKGMIRAKPLNSCLAT